MARDRITELRIEGMRTIDKLTLKLDGLTVLIGENGSGKSTIIEACEILRRAAGENFFSEFLGIHGGLYSTLRNGAKRLGIGISVDGDEGHVDYDFSIGMVDGGPAITGEHIFCRQADGATSRLDRTKDSMFAFRGARVGDDPERLLGLRYWADESDAALQVLDTIVGIDVHVPFETLPAWVSRAHDRKSVGRGSVLLQPASRLERLGGNLPNAFKKLKNGGVDEWLETMELVRLGLGDQFESVNTRAMPEGGAVALSVKLAGLDEQIPASALSDGQLAYLAFVALFRLDPGRSLLAFDEPDLHLHPRLLSRVLGFFESMAREHPVLLATHSDRLLDALQDPAASVVLCDLDPQAQATRISRPDPEALARWRDEFNGIGELRSEGYLDTVMKKVEQG